ncbi:hypothetical protein IQ06DRAFT_4530 [Phaeosphaeriaceae sp. SRC1lsM3a]|nr:hypothetical protein IQ06DRAFT_4530 [Stagonospora sp. SRC1lsM3a]
MDLCTPLRFQLGVIDNAAALQCAATTNEMTNHAVRSCGLRRYAITCIPITLYTPIWYSRPSVLASESGASRGAPTLSPANWICRTSFPFQHREDFTRLGVVKSSDETDSIDAIETQSRPKHPKVHHHEQHPGASFMPVLKLIAERNASQRSVRIISGGGDRMKSCGATGGAAVPAHRYMLSTHKPRRVQRFERKGYHNWQASIRLCLSGSRSTSTHRLNTVTAPGRS